MSSDRFLGFQLMQLSWSDPRLSVASDGRRTARYRLLQSWYREQVLTAEYGDYRVNGGTRPLGSLLALHDVVERPGLNFLTPAAATYAMERAELVQAAGGAHRQGPAGAQHAVEPADDVLDLRRAALAQDRGLDAVRAFLDPHAVAVDVMECSWRPAVDVLGDRSGVRRGGRHRARRRLASPHRHRGEVHRAVQPHDLQQRRLPPGARVQRAGSTPGTARPLVGPATNQLWRTSLLAAACAKRQVMGVTSASVVVMCLGERPGRRARAGRTERSAAHAVGALPDRVAGVVRGRDPRGARAAGAVGRRVRDPLPRPAVDHGRAAGRRLAVAGAARSERRHVG